MANKFDGDIRPLSNDPRYMGVVFQGSMASALMQAQEAIDYGLPEQPGKPAHISRDRWNLLEHLNLSTRYLERKPPKRAELSKYSLAYAIERGWIIPVQS